ncbi:DUF1775 domain-containing protein [Blastococcus sp. KM273128]|uniref:DUF1775 domain-containing protein n=1 Tax=Blastococcus sp. KM273128 TaxID=2570314 RepID=UPI001F32D003|nr:DUF1775 domain-containing protein [Blastococcus sp. KM273128]MCF6745000.1 DUF1775 domain-containing protein [Blastococcus sp. KM273128]
MTDFFSFRFSRRAATVAVCTLGLLFAGVAPANAHVEAAAEGAQAGTGPVTVSFLAEAESTTAGIVGVKAQLPAGIPPASVSLASGPPGWVLTATPDGYEVSGPDIGPGVDLKYGITIAMLPRDTTELPFKTLLRYSDGREDAWIELPTDANPDPEQPAPAITVAPAPPAPTTTAPSSPAATATAASPSAGADTPSAAPQEAAAATAEDFSATGWIVAGVVVVALALAGLLWFWRRRASSQRG